MTKQKREKIKSLYETFEEIEPDISTERLLSQVADACNCDVEDVAEIVTEDSP